MPPFVEVPCKTLKELPRNVGENVLALAAVNKKWSRLPRDVRDLVAQNMRRETPSAMAMKAAFGDGLTLPCSWMKRVEYVKNEHRCWTEVQWSIVPYSGQCSSTRKWRRDCYEYTKHGSILKTYNLSNFTEYSIDTRSEYEMRVNPKPHLMLANGQRLLI